MILTPLKKSPQFIFFLQKKCKKNPLPNPHALTHLRPRPLTKLPKTRTPSEKKLQKDFFTT